MIAALEIAWWWGAAIGIWLLTLSSVTTPDLVVATACGLPCALAARAGRRAMGGCWRPRLRWLAWLASLAPAIPADQVRLWRAAARRLAGGEEPGELREIPLAAGEPAAVASAHRAAAIITVSSTPGTYAVDADPEEDKLVIHSLASGWPHLEEKVER
jgi:multisubunit Na+/H+ antiporter MnhE subunit